MALLDGVETVEPIDSVLVAELVEVDVTSVVSVFDAVDVVVTEESWVEVAKARLDVAASRLESNPSIDEETLIAAV